MNVSMIINRARQAARRLTRRKPQGEPANPAELLAVLDVLDWATARIMEDTRRMQLDGALSDEAALVARLCAAAMECAGRELRRAVKQEPTKEQNA